MTGGGVTQVRRLFGETCSSCQEHGGESNRADNKKNPGNLKNRTPAVRLRRRQNDVVKGRVAQAGRVQQVSVRFWRHRSVSLALDRLSFVAMERRP